MQEKPRTAVVHDAPSNSGRAAQSNILAGKVVQVQQEVVEAVVEDHFMPFLHEHAKSGIAKATLVMMLTNAHRSERRSKKRVWYADGRTE